MEEYWEGLAARAAQVLLLIYIFLSIYLIIMEEYWEGLAARAAQVLLLIYIFPSIYLSIYLIIMEKCC